MILSQQAGELFRKLREEFSSSPFWMRPDALRRDAMSEGARLFEAYDKAVHDHYLGLSGDMVARARHEVEIVKAAAAATTAGYMERIAELEAKLRESGQ